MAVYKASDMRTWNEKAKARVRDVVRASIQDVVADAQQTKASGGRMPVDTGFLRNSLMCDVNGTTALEGPLSYVAVISGLEMGDIFTAKWTAPYALRQERGFVGVDSLGRTYNQPGNYYVQGAVQQWPIFVEENVRAVST